MGNWIACLVRGRSLELAVAVSLGYAGAKLAENVASVPVVILAQHVSNDERVLDLVNLFSSCPAHTGCERLRVLSGPPSRLWVCQDSLSKEGSDVVPP